MCSQAYESYSSIALISWEWFLVKWLTHSCVFLDKLFLFSLQNTVLPGKFVVRIKWHIPLIPLSITSNTQKSKTFLLFIVIIPLGLVYTSGSCPRTQDVRDPLNKCRACIYEFYSGQSFNLHFTYLIYVTYLSSSMKFLSRH